MPPAGYLWVRGYVSTSAPLGDARCRVVAGYRSVCRDSAGRSRKRDRCRVRRFRWQGIFDITPGDIEVGLTMSCQRRTPE